MVLFITGPSGAGKSTLAAAWVASQEREIALIDADQITSWLRLGEQSAVNAAFAEGTEARIAEQYRITAEVYAAAAHKYAARGIDVVIAQLCGFDPPPPWAKGWDLLDPLRPIFVVLYPKREVCQERLVARGGHIDMSSYDFDWSAWKAYPRSLFLDNSTLSIDESVAKLEVLLAEQLSTRTNIDQLHPPPPRRSRRARHHHLALPAALRPL